MTCIFELPLRVSARPRAITPGEQIPLRGRKWPCGSSPFGLFQTCEGARCPGQGFDEQIDRQTRNRVTPRSSNVAQRNQNKGALVQPRMRQYRGSALDAAIIIDNIEIEWPRRVPFRRLAPKRPFGSFQHRKQRVRCERRFESRNGVHEFRVCRVGPGDASVEW